MTAPPPPLPTPPVVPPPSGKSIWTRWWMIVIYVIVGIGVFANLFPADDEGDLTASPTTTVEGATTITAGDAAPATPTETTATTSESRAATTTEAPLVGESSLDSPIQLGAVVQAGSWRLRVSAITPDGTDEVMEENQFNDPPPEGNQFFIASLEATYTGTESSTFWVDMTLKSVGDSNVAYEAYEASCGVIPDDIDDSGETFPGGTVTGNVCWSIESTDAASLVMIVEESFNFDDDTRAFLSLDPTATPINETTSSTSATESTSPQETTTVPEAPAVSQATSSLAPASGTSYTENDIEYKLAVVDKGGFVPLDDPVIKRYEQALDALEPKCTESRTLIADQSVLSVQLLADSGVVTNALEMLRAADDSIPPELGETRCSEIFAALIVLLPSTLQP